LTTGARNASTLAEIFLAVSGSCDAGRPALFPDLCGRVFADRERLYRISALIEFAGATSACSIPIAKTLIGENGSWRGIDDWSLLCAGLTVIAAKIAGDRC
jgi:hypothetical protein